MNHIVLIDRGSIAMTTIIELPFHHQEMIKRELEPGEQVVWAAMPSPQYFTPAATAGFLFGIPWLAISLFFTAKAALDAAEAQAVDLLDWFYPLIGVPFVFAGFGLLSCPIFAFRNASRTVYVVTDRRAITFQGGWSLTVRSYWPDKLQDVFRREHRNGTGDVVIACRAWRDGEGDRQIEDLGFLRIADPKHAESLLKELARQRDEQQLRPSE